MAEGGIQECGNAQNCVAVCPKEIPFGFAVNLIRLELANETGQDKFQDTGLTQLTREMSNVL